MLNSLNKIDNSLLSSVKRLSPLNMKRSNNNYSFAFVANHLIYYPTPTSLTYAWSFGFLAGMCLLTQMISGIFLAMYYAPHVDLAFSSVEYIMCDVPNGWFLRYVHANGASMFFIVVYSHIFRGLYYGSYMKSREILGCSGLIVAGFFFVFCSNQSITSIFLIICSIFQFSLLFFYGWRLSSLASQVVYLYSIMYPTTWIVSKERFRIILLFVVILFIGVFQTDSLTSCGWEEWKPCESNHDDIELLRLLNLDSSFSRKFLIGDTNLALKELDEINRFLTQSDNNTKIKVLESFYLRKDFNEMANGVYNYYQVIKTTLIRAQDGNPESFRHAIIDPNCNALPAVRENNPMPHGCVVGRNPSPNNEINIIHKPEYVYSNVPIVTGKNSFKQLFSEYLDYLLQCRELVLPGNYNLLPETDGKGSTLEYGLVFLEDGNEGTPYRLTCWWSPSDGTSWNSVIVPETAHLGPSLIDWTGNRSIDPVLSKFGIGMQSSPTWENLEGKSFVGSLLVGYKAEVLIPAFTTFIR